MWSIEERVGYSCLLRKLLSFTADTVDIVYSMTRSFYIFLATSVLNFLCECRRKQNTPDPSFQLDGDRKVFFTSHVLSIVECKDFPPIIRHTSFDVI